MELINQIIFHLELNSNNKEGTIELLKEFNFPLNKKEKNWG